mgnify:CR=1 FL=1
MNMPLDKVLCGDALKVLRTLPERSVHLAITSPPYNAGMDYDTYDDDRPLDVFLSHLRAVFTETWRVLVRGGRLAVNAPNAVKNRRSKSIHYLSPRIALILEDVGFLPREWITWHKGRSANHFQGNNTAWGSWQSPANNCLRPLSEAIIVVCKEDYRLPGDPAAIDLTSDEFKEWTKNIWYIPNTASKKDHPAPFPLELPERLIKLYSYRGNVVLDMFNGTGSTTTAACLLGRHFIGIDVSPAYCAMARRALKKAQSLHPLSLPDSESSSSATRPESSDPAGIGTT